jgi:hypothetical protein
MADSRQKKRVARAARKAAKIARREQRKNEKTGVPRAVGFDAKAPEAAELGTGNAGAAVPTATTPAPPAPPAPVAPQPATTPVTPDRPVIGFDATAPKAAHLGPIPELDVTGPVGTETRRLATGLTAQAAQRAAEVDIAGMATEALYPLTAAQQATVDAVQGAVASGVYTRIPTADIMALPVSARADLLDAVRTTPGAALTVVPGAEDVDALALLVDRHGSIDPADIYTHPADAPPAVQAGIAADLQRMADAEAAAAAAAKTDGASTEPVTDPPIREEDTDTALPNNVIPFKQRNTTPQRMELPMTTPTAGSGEISGLNQAITYAEGLSAYCTHTTDQIGTVLPNGEEAVASCEQALNNLGAGGVTGRALQDVASVQEQMTNAVAELQAALAQLEAAGAAAESLKVELTSHLAVQEAYAATPDAGSKEFVNAE